jgi:calcineurin-like phosphoesterase family protein
MIYFTADTHFNHDNIIKYTQRPFKDVNEMNNVIITNWNKVVKKDDTVFFLGDFCFKGSFHKMRSKLQGEIIFIIGNHDFSNGVKSVITECQIEYKGQEFNLMHDPNPYNSNYEYNLSGHVHKLWKTKKVGKVLYINVGVDVWDFKPVSIIQIMEMIKDGN